MSTLKRSERNCIIEDYRNGVVNPYYEVIQTKTKGRYTVRKRKVPLTEEQCDELSQNQNDEYDDDDIEVKPKAKPKVKQVQQPMTVTNLKKDNALFNLQNQLNEQMLYRLTELTNKVTKLKSWKKSIKQVLEQCDDDDVEQVTQQQDNNDVEQDNNDVEQVSQQQDNTTQQQEYLNRIPQEYVEPIDEQYSMPQYYNTRSHIDYSKFGF